MTQTLLTKTRAEQVIHDNLEYTLFSWSKQGGQQPLAIQRAEGVYLYDYDGKRFLDFSSGLMNVNIGHGHRRITDAVVRQMQEVSYVTPNCVTAVRGELGRRLSALFPGDLKKCFFTVCGASAIENAIKLARVYTGRHKIISRYQSYHGSSYAAISASGDPRRLAVDAQQAPHFVHFDLPYTYRWNGSEEELLAYGISQLERIIAFEGPGNVAAVLLEGQSGSSGCFLYPKGYLQAVRELTARNGILLIIDEVMSGFGRTGQWFAFQHDSITPDLVAMAKGITSGYLPFGCLMVSDRIAASFEEVPLPLGLTYSGHPVCCAAALETLNVYEEEGLIEQAAAMGRYMDRQMLNLVNRHPCIGDWRNRGLLGCLELVKNRHTREPLVPFNAKPEEMTGVNRLIARLKDLGLYTFVRWNFIFVAPPLCITEEQIDEGLQLLSEALLVADDLCEA